MVFKYNYLYLFVGYQNVDYGYGSLKLIGTGFNSDLVSSLLSANVLHLSE